MAKSAMSADSNAPIREEKVKQLERILASRTFERYQKLRQLLERLVTDNLKGAVGDNYEHTLGVDVFGKRADWIPMDEAVVRQGMSNLRTRVKLYYRAEGHDDEVIISFPKRSGYAPRFSYNPVSNAEESVRRIADRLGHAFPDLMNCGGIVEELEGYIAKHPSYAPAYGVLAEAILACAACDETYAFAAPQAIVKAEEAVKTGLELHGELWGLHVAAGAIHCCRFAWDKADEAFSAALRLAPDETRAHFWYGAFLLAVGRTEEAKQCVSFREREMARARFTSYIRPLFLYVMREFKEAYDNLTLQSPFFADIASRFAYYCGDEIVPFDDWPVEILMACLCLALDQSRAAARYAEAGVLHSKVGALNGLVVLARAGMGTLHENARENAMSFLGRLENEARWQSPVSLALAYMGVGRMDEAIAKLEEACNDRHPLMVWLHLWPVFDPLRSHERFKALMRRMNLPA